MIQQILIKNFQSHKEIVLDLCPGVNALIGLTGAGKSVVFKALNWVFSNRPLGTEYRSWWGGDTQVEIVLEGSQKVGRIRSDNDNCYYIDKKEFRAFGNGPPPQPVLDLLNLSEVNLQMQSDPSFLISNSSGEVARYLNKAAHLDVIDQALSSIASTLRKEKEDLGQARKDLDQTQGQLVLYDWLQEADGKLMELERLQERVSCLNKEISGVQTIVEEYEQTAIVLVAVQNVLFFSKEVDRLLGLHSQIENQNVRWEQLAAIIDQYEKAGKELEGLIPLEKMRSETKRLLVLEEGIRDKRQKYYAFFDLVSDYDRAKKEITSYDWLSKATEEVERLENLNFGVGKLKANELQLTALVRSVSEVSESLTQTEKEHEKLQKEFTRLMPNICPLCDGTGGKRLEK